MTKILCIFLLDTYNTIRKCIEKLNSTIKDKKGYPTHDRERLILDENIKIYLNNNYKCTYIFSEDCHYNRLIEITIL